MGETTTTKKNNFTLPNETINVKFIHRKRGMASNVQDDHVIAGGMLTTATKRFQAPLKKNGSIANVLTNEEKETLESITGLNLSVYGDYWKDFFVTLRKEDNTFDLSNPVDYMSYKVLMSLKDDIAKSWDERNDKQTYQFVITRKGEETKANKKKYDSKKEAFKLYGKVEDDKTKLLGILKILTQKPVSENSSMDWLQEQVEKIIDETPTKFVKLVKDESFYTMLLMHKGLDVSVIKREGNKYSTVDGLPLAEADEIPTFDNAIRYLDNPKNQEIRSLIEAKINNAE